ncbi:MAG: hypothetical protein ACOX5G_00610 [Kiritimatiellia bacterium]|jgi:hypothetical protein
MARLRPAFLGLLAVLLAGVAWRADETSRRLRAERDRIGGEPGAAAVSRPSILASYVTVGLAGFRGIVAEALWLRAAWLQDRGRYLELVQLAEWICALDPKSADAWTFQAWNLAYNVSSVLPRARDRWRWVEHGVSLLRDRAIPMNPDDPRLYRELGWLFQNKIGSYDLDRAHATYKLSLLAQVAPFLDPDGSAPAAGSAQETGLRDTLRLDAASMRTLEERYGPIDWRIPESHALYWATKALALAPARSFEEQAALRMIHQSLVALVGRGSFCGDLSKGRWEARANFALIPGTCAAFEKEIAGRPASGNQTAYAAFLLDAARHLKPVNENAARLYYSRIQSLDLPDLPIPPFESLGRDEP